MKIIAHNVTQAYMTLFNAKTIGEDKRGPSFSATVIVNEDSRFSVPEKGLKRVTIDKLEPICKALVKAKCGKNTPKDKNWFLNPADGSGTRDAYVDDSGDYLDGFSEDSFLLSGKKYPKDIAKSKCGQFDKGELYVVNKAKDRITAQDAELKPGDRVNVAFDVYAYDGSKSKTPNGCTATIEGIQKWADGTALDLGVGSSGVDDDDFEAGEMEGDDAAELM